VNEKLKTPERKTIIRKTGKQVKKKKKTKISLKKVTLLFVILILLIILPFVSCSENFKTIRNRAMAKSEIIYRSGVFTPSEKEREDRPYPVINKKTGLYCFVYNKTSSGTVKLTGDIYENGFCSTGFFTDNNKTKIFIAAAKKDGKWGYLKFTEEPSGKMKLEGTFENNFYIEPVYESAEPFYNGIAAVKQNGLYGFISMDGMFILQPQYFDVRYYNEGMIPVKNADAWYFTDTNGKVILGLYEEAESFSDGYALVKQNGLWGYIKKDGSYAVEPSFKDGWEVIDNKAWVLEKNFWKNIKIT
jgi:uncharacterized protein YegP (UPF0339 family)